MPYNPKHLASGENPPSVTSQIMANTMSSWTDARKYSLPQYPYSLTAVTAASGYSASGMGSHWQRFVNTFALDLDLLTDVIQENLTARYLEYPGTNHQSLDIIYVYGMPSLTTTVLGVSANSDPIYLAGSVDINGNQMLDPNRSTNITLLEADQLFDFYYGISQSISFVGSGANTSFVLPNRVGQNLDGSYQIEWVTIDETETTNYSLASDQMTISLDATVGHTVTVHFTTYDVYYVLVEDLPQLYLRSNYFEIFTETSGTAPTSNQTINNQPSNVSILTPQIHMLWNELDEIGLLLSKPRAIGETNTVYQQRLIDSVLYPSSATQQGMINALVTELGLVNHIGWGPNPTLTPAVSGTVIAISNQTYENSILVDRLPLPYYSISTTETNGNILSIPSLDIGESYTASVQFLASGGPVVPGLAPFTFTSSLGVSAQATYDQIAVTRAQSYFPAPTNAWYPSSLKVWKNGIPLISGIDYTEWSQVLFQLTTPAQIGDLLQLGYIYDASISPPELESQPDILTDLAPIITISAQYSIDALPYGIQSFPGYTNVPPGYDPNTAPTNGTWTMTFVFTNAGSAASDPFTFTVNLPPNISYDSSTGFLSISDLSDNHEVRYIDAARVWVYNLTDPALQDLLYNARGQATYLLQAFANEINISSPLEWGNISWDRSIWRTLTERYSAYGFLPNILDPQYQDVLIPTTTLSIGSLVVGGNNLGVTSLLGQSAAGNFPVGVQSNNQPLFIDFNTPGVNVGTSLSTRYPQFQSGIGDKDDCKVSVLTSSQLLAASAAISPIQQAINGSPVNNINFTIPGDQLNAWWLGIEPGFYYLNQEEHYYFALPMYIETTASQAYLPGAQPSTYVWAAQYNDSNGLIPLRRVYFHDNFGNFSLTNTEVLSGSGNTRYLTYNNVSNVQFISASDSNTYSVSSTDDGQGLITINTSTSASITVSYILQGSFCIIEDNNGDTILFDQSYPNGILVIYEGSSGTSVSGLPVHPYYNPRQNGFVYLTSDFYVPSKLTLQVNPTSVPADGVTTFSIRCLVEDSYGNASEGIPVSILVNYTEGPISFNGVTDNFGFVTTRLNSSPHAQVATIIAAVQLFDSNNSPLSSLLDQSSIECYTPFL